MPERPSFVEHVYFSGWPNSASGISARLAELSRTVSCWPCWRVLPDLQVFYMRVERVLCLLVTSARLTPASIVSKFGIRRRFFTAARALLANQSLSTVDARAE